MMDNLRFPVLKYLPNLIIANVQSKTLDHLFRSQIPFNEIKNLKLYIKSGFLTKSPHIIFRGTPKSRKSR